MLKDARHQHPRTLHKQIGRPYILTQAAIVQFNKSEDPVTPPASVHVKCTGAGGFGKGVHSKLPLQAGGPATF